MIYSRMRQRFNHCFNVALFASIIFQIAIAFDLEAQTVYIDMLGNSAGFYTVNYEHLLSDKGQKIWSLHAGAGMYNEFETYTHKSFPVGVSYYNKKESNHHKEIGLCLNYVEGLEDNRNSWIVEGVQYSKTLVAIANIGYRYQKPKGGFMFKAYYAPAMVLKEFEEPPYHFTRQTLYTFNFGISLGYTF